MDGKGRWGIWVRGARVRRGDLSRRSLGKDARSHEAAETIPEKRSTMAQAIAVCTDQAPTAMMWTAVGEAGGCRLHDTVDILVKALYGVITMSLTKVNHISRASRSRGSS